MRAGEGPGVRVIKGRVMKKIRKIPQYLVKLCREFRRNPTVTEAFIWSCLRNRQLHGYKFRRQRPIGRYIVDFYCAELRLVIEVDGAVHQEKDQMEYDTIRQEEIEIRGYKVIRISTSEIRRNPSNALSKIIDAIENPEFPSPLTPLSRERERGRG